MATKLLGILGGVLLVVIVVLGLQLHSANQDVITATSARDAAKQDASNAREAQKTAEAQNTALADRFSTLDGRLTGLEQSQRETQKALETQIAQLSQIKKTEGDSDESITCLDVSVPHQLDQWLRDTAPATGANGSH